MKIHLKTYGCSQNIADSETMMGILNESGHIFVDLEDADLIIENTCTVKGPTESKFFTRLKRLKEYGKPIIICGCIAQTAKDRLKEFSTVGPDNIAAIAEVVEETKNGRIMHLTERLDNKRLCLPKIRVNPYIEIIPISKGCLGECTYCKVRSARGRLHSYEPEAIIRRAKEAAKDGVKEIWLTSQDNGAYGLDMGTDLPSLLQEIIKIPGDHMIRIGMANPQFVHRYLNRLIDIFKSERVYRFIHMPIQSGSDNVLKVMKRPYTAAMCREIVKRLRTEIPDISISTDIIVAFPGETKKDLDATLRFIEETELDVLNLSRYWARPGTEAAKMKQIDGKTPKSRSLMVLELFEKVGKKRNDTWVGWEGPIIVTESCKNGTYTGRNYSYKPIIIKSDLPLVGEKIEVTITAATHHDLRAEIINQKLYKPITSTSLRWNKGR
ncbi:2-methylthioadenine synthetase [Candidatus Woesearchaeota archaeon CG11_big_fil_rev_8_21_14_0_20_43_8]|nr:MAG: 2-methylthioadenine synthetase [Candidatus Woesearchaeota archaeon CG11_big_fil_rev_8_21_14_0_20_43_8]PIO05455.1 MAG: 2-methylthioadenine synthetase [Candidatus Woesearchaeota archaeon CG08_land_8_20_14_0_20_43_7]